MVSLVPIILPRTKYTHLQPWIWGSGLKLGTKGVVNRGYKGFPPVVMAYNGPHMSVCRWGVITWSHHHLSRWAGDAAAEVDSPLLFLNGAQHHDTVVPVQAVQHQARLRRGHRRAQGRSSGPSRNRAARRATSWGVHARGEQMVGTRRPSDAARRQLPRRLAG